MITVTWFDSDSVELRTVVLHSTYISANNQYKAKSEHLEEHKKVCKATYNGLGREMEVRGAEIVYPFLVKKKKLMSMMSYTTI